MRVDGATLHDLDVPSTGDAARSVTGLLDRTRSAVGANALRLRLLTPLTTSEAIRDVQGALRLLAAELPVVQQAIDRASLDTAPRYLDGRWELPWSMSLPARVVETVWTQLRYRTYCREVSAGLRRVQAMLAQARAVAAMFRGAPNAVLAHHANAIDTALKDPHVLPLTRIRGAPATFRLLHLDRLARGEARASLQRLIEALAAIDALSALAAATVEHGWVFPELRDGPLRIEALRHPLLPQGIPNDLILDDTTRLLLLTGPNMAGKTTFLKSLGLSLYLAHLGCGVPARAMQFPLLSGLSSSIQIHDDLGRGESFYLAEVRRVRTLVEMLLDGGCAVALIDEPFRGTNMHDAADASRLLFERLARHPRAFVVVATHLIEVVDALADLPGIQCAAFDATTTAGQLEFTFRLREGVSRHRLGMELLRREGVIDALESW